MTGFLAPLLDLRLPDGLGMTFDEEMDGVYLPGVHVPPGRQGDLELDSKIPADGRTCRRRHVWLSGSRHRPRSE